jgi:hypothetical protein
VAWALLGVFIWIYGKNQRQKAEQKDLKNVQLGQKRRVFKVVVLEGMVSEEIVPLKRSQALCTG